MYFTNVLKSAKDLEGYVAFTKDLKLRFEQHQNGFVESTRDRRPPRLIYSEACLESDDPIRCEKYLKTSHAKMLLRRRLKSYLTG
jgi:putative endonuclease